MLLGASLGDFSRWARSNGLEIVMIVCGSVLFARAASWARTHSAARIDAGSTSADAVVRSEEAKHRHALTQVITWTVVTLIYFISGIIVLQRFDVPLTSLVASATIAGVALGFGAPRVVQNLLGGFFVISERQYGYGDVIRVLQPGSLTGITGTVEDITLRATVLRTTSGEVLIVPNGDVRQVINLSRDWARAVVDVLVPLGTDIARLSTVLRPVGDDAFHDPTGGADQVDVPAPRHRRPTSSTAPGSPAGSSTTNPASSGTTTTVAPSPTTSSPPGRPAPAPDPSSAGTGWSTS